MDDPHNQGHMETNNNLSRDSNAEQEAKIMFEQLLLNQATDEEQKRDAMATVDSDDCNVVAVNDKSGDKSEEKSRGKSWDKSASGIKVV